MNYTVQRIAAFSRKGKGGNPAGVLICEKMPTADEMLAIAKDVGYSETAFLHPHEDGWRIRYFAPEIEVPFCGHATIATGLALGEHSGVGTYKLYLNEGEIMLSIEKQNDNFMIALQSPPTWSQDTSTELIDTFLKQFNLSKDDLHNSYPIKIAGAGARHLIVPLKNRERLSKMSYNFDTVKKIMLEEELTTIDLFWVESDTTIHSRNAFASGGVYEDPATGAAAAALAGYLRDISWSGNNSFEILQGEDMNVPSRLLVEYTNEKGSSVKISGEARHIEG